VGKQHLIVCICERNGDLVLKIKMATVLWRWCKLHRNMSGLCYYNYICYIDMHLLVDNTIYCNVSLLRNDTRNTQSVINNHRMHLSMLHNLVTQSMKLCLSFCRKVSDLILTFEVINQVIGFYCLFGS
jgi:hypothetical protein